MSKKEEFLKEDVMGVLKNLGLKVNLKTGGCLYKEEYAKAKISQTQNGLFALENGDKKIVFLNSQVFLSTIKMVEESLKYKLFD